jgi:hypothetical protein
MVIGFGWSQEKRFDTCINCNKNKWVKDVDGYDQILKDEKWFIENKVNIERERKINELLK